MVYDLHFVNDLLRGFPQNLILRLARLLRLERLLRLARLLRFEEINELVIGDHLCVWGWGERLPGGLVSPGSRFCSPLSFSFQMETRRDQVRIVHARLDLVRVAQGLDLVRVAQGWQDYLDHDTTLLQTC